MYGQVKFCSEVRVIKKITDYIVEKDILDVFKRFILCMLRQELCLNCKF